MFLFLEIIKKIIGLAPLFVGAFVGIFPMLYTSIGTSIISYFLNSSFSGKMLGYTSWKQLKDIAPSFFIAMIMAVIVYVMKFLPLSNWIILPIQIVVGVAVLLGLCKLTKIKEYDEAKELVMPILNKFKHR